MAGRTTLNVTIIGAGRVGSVLGRVLVEEGQTVVSVLSRTRSSARKAASFIGAKSFSNRLSDIPPSTDCVYITTPHGAVEDVARALANLEHLQFRALAVCHASGMHTAEVLQSLGDRGATVFSFHPLQTFPRDFHPRDILPTARGIYYGVDGSRAGIAFARRLAKVLRGSVLLVPPEVRVLYHAACVVASNHLTTMFAVVQEMGERCGMRSRDLLKVFGPIADATLRNIAQSSPADALSGPIARGGVETLSRHLQVIQEELPAVLPYFGAVSLETVRLAQRKGSITDPQAAQMCRRITSFLNPSTTKRGGR
jgi:predicted short-subunit dehydrogenase-like oxidoreductase (DUF2520 family)